MVSDMRPESPFRPVGDTVDDADDCCIQFGRQCMQATQGYLSVAHASLQNLMSGPALAQDAFLGINICVLCCNPDTTISL